MIETDIPYHKPWVGKNYFISPFRSVRLLLVGESSFERDFVSQPEHLSEDTKCVADGNFEPRYAGFWRFIQRAVTGDHEIRKTALYEFWHGVSLVNWIQRPMSSKHARPTFEDYGVGCTALKSYIKDLDPQGVIVFSKTAWPSIIESFGLLPTHTLVTDTDSVSELVLASSLAYSAGTLTDGPKFLLLRHPSSWPKTSGVSWSPIVHAFTEQIRHNTSRQPRSGRDAARLG